MNKERQNGLNPPISMQKDWKNEGFNPPKTSQPQPPKPQPPKPQPPKPQPPKPQTGSK